MRGCTGRGAGPRGNGLRGVLFLAALVWGMSGCELMVTKSDYERDKRQAQDQLQVIRKQLLAHTQILANHGKSINEVRLQIRDALSLLKKKTGRERAQAEAAPPEGEEKPAAGSSAGVAKRKTKGFPVGKSVFIRSSYRGSSLDYAGGYHSPSGRRYSYKLLPGTGVQVLSEDRRGFTRVQVKTGRWKGKKMWVRTQWLIEKPPARGRRPVKG